MFVPDGELLLPQILRRLGYSTAIKNENPQAGIHNCLRGFKHVQILRSLGSYSASKQRKMGCLWKLILNYDL